MIKQKRKWIVKGRRSTKKSGNIKKKRKDLHKMQYASREKNLLCGASVLASAEQL